MCLVPILVEGIHLCLRVDVLQVDRAYLVEFAVKGHIGRDARVLQLGKPFVGEDMQVTVGHYLTQRMLPRVRHSMLLAREPAQQIVDTEVQRLLNQMMHDTLVGLAVRVIIDRAGTIESITGEPVTILVAEIAHFRMYLSPFAVMTLSSGRSHRRSKMRQ